MDRFERIFSSSRRREKAAVETLPVITPQLPSPRGPLFPSPSFIRPTTTSMKPREEERRLRTPEDRERTFSISSQGRGPSRLVSNSPSTKRGSPRHKDLREATPDSHSDIHSPSKFKFPEDSIFRNDAAHRYSMQNTQRAVSMEQVNEEPAELSVTAKSNFRTSSPQKVTIARPVSTGLFRPVFYDARQDHSPIIMPTPISPALAAGALSMLESLPPSPNRTSLPDKGLYLPVLPRLNRFSTLNLPHLESPSASDSEDDCLLYGQYPSPASLATPNTFSTRESFDSPAHSLVSSFSSKKNFRETWCARADDPFASTRTTSSDAMDPVASPHDSVELWLPKRSSSMSSSKDWFSEPDLSEFLALTDDEVAEKHSAAVTTELQKGPTPPPKDTPKPIKRSSTFSHHTGLQKSTSTCTVRADSEQPHPPSPTKVVPRDRTSQSTTKPEPIRASALISTIATTFGFDEIYIMSFWPDDRKRRGRLLDFPMHFENARSSKASRRESKPKVAGRLLASYGMEGATGSWELPTDILAEALDTEETWYEYQDATPPPDGLSHGFMCSFYGNCLPSSQPVSENMVNRGIVFAAFHTQSKPIITSGTLSDRNLLLSDLRLLAKVLVDETIKNL